MFVLCNCQLFYERWKSLVFFIFIFYMMHPAIHCFKMEYEVGDVKRELPLGHFINMQSLMLTCACPDCVPCQTPPKNGP